MVFKPPHQMHPHMDYLWTQEAPNLQELRGLGYLKQNNTKPKPQTCHRRKKASILRRWRPTKRSRRLFLKATLLSILHTEMNSRKKQHRGDRHTESRLQMVLLWVWKSLPRSSSTGRHFLFHFHLSDHSNISLSINSCTHHPVPDSAAPKHNWLTDSLAWMPENCEALRKELQSKRKLQHELVLHMTPGNTQRENPQKTP